MRGRCSSRSGCRRVSTIGRPSCRVGRSSASRLRARSIRRPRLVLCDEPTGNLDQASASGVASLLLDLHKTQQNILIVVTHSERLASQFPIRFELAGGKVQRIA